MAKRWTDRWPDVMTHKHNAFTTYTELPIVGRGLNTETIKSKKNCDTKDQKPDAKSQSYFLTLSA